MLYYEENIFYPINHKTDYIKISDLIKIHYKISSDRQNQRWFIAVTLEDNGMITPQYQLSKQFQSYGQIIAYINILPSIFLEGKTKQTIDNEMYQDFIKIKNLVQKIMDALYEFEAKYNI